MARTTAAWSLALVVVSWTAMARGQPCLCGTDGLADPLQSPAIEELQAVMASSVAVGLVSYVFATAFASTQPHYVWTTDSIPVAGAIISVARNGSREAPLLLFSAATQAISILVAIVAGTEIAEERRRWEIGAGISGDGGGMSLHLRF